MLCFILFPSLLIGSLGFLYQVPHVKLSIILILFVLIMFVLIKISKYQLQDLRDNPEKAEELNCKYEKQDRFWAEHYIMRDLIGLVAITGFFIIGSLVVLACRAWILSS
jgi:hypothetical protein